jgi:hypothetical protein
MRLAAAEDKYWDVQVRHSAVAWTASGGRGAPIAPEEEIAMLHTPGGRDTLSPPTASNEERRANNKVKKQAVKVRRRAEITELQAWRTGSPGGSAL